MNEATTYETSHKTILVCDDDDLFRQRLARAFSDRGYHTLQAASREEAINIAKQYDIDFAVIDLRLNSDSGLEILQDLIAIDPEIKSTILTGYGSINTAVKALKLGAAHYLTKPVDADSILSSFKGEEASANESELPHLAQVEWDYIQRVIDECGGNITKSSKMLGLHRRSLQRKLAKMPGKVK